MEGPSDYESDVGSNQSQNGDSMMSNSSGLYIYFIHQCIVYYMLQKVNTTIDIQTNKALIFLFLSTS